MMVFTGGILTAQNFGHGVSQLIHARKDVENHDSLPPDMQSKQFIGCFHIQRFSKVNRQRFQKT
jgi:hypothetical protein